MANLSVYIETTIPSYLVAKASADKNIARRQDITREWWKKRDHYLLAISPELIREISAGSAHYAAKRIELLAGIPLLEPVKAVEELAEALLSSRIFPPNARSDAIHLAFASVHALDVLVTWNLRHIANPVSMKRSRQIVTMAGCEMPEICTPEQLLATGA